MTELKRTGGDKPLVSIVIPTFNRAKILQQAIDSSLAQSHDVEVIVVNHGSTDNTDEIVSSYGDRVYYIKRDRDFGPHFCWLDGVPTMQCHLLLGHCAPLLQRLHLPYWLQQT